MVWEEVKIAQNEKRYELVLHGSVISQRIGESGLDETIFELTNLNFLQISQTDLSSLPDALGELTNLRTLDLHQNHLIELPKSIGKLQQLNFCDISGNLLKYIPEQLGDLVNLHTLNLSCNALSKLPSFEKLQSLAKFDCSHNELVQLPSGVYQLKHLAELRASSNLIECIEENVSKSSGLKALDLSSNRLTTLPIELTECHKLKELTLTDNPIGDNRLNKLIKQCSTKSVLDYITKTSGKGKGKKGRKHTKSVGEGENEPEGLQPVIQVKRSDDYQVIASQSIIDVRPYIVCVVVKRIDLTHDVFKKFIDMQTKLHESVCENRAAATIATHCMTSLEFPLTYQVLPLDEICMMPLGKQKQMTGTEILADLKESALKEKQRTKRQPKSGLLKYLALIENVESLAFLKSKSGDIISLPPVTNSELSKIAPECMDILIEVTSSRDLKTCKHVMDAFIKNMFEAGMHSMSIDEVAESQMDGQKKLLLGQVRVIMEEGNLKVVYPSKTDLSFERLPVVHI